MRFHTGLTREQMLSVRLPAGVSWYRLKEQGSRSRARKFDMVLSGNSAYGGRFGAQDYAAATWDEWGVVLGQLFELDPAARVPGIYEGFHDFHDLTGERYYPDDLPLTLCKRHKWIADGYYGQDCARCDAHRQWHRSPIGDQNPAHVRSAERHRSDSTAAQQRADAALAASDRELEAWERAHGDVGKPESWWPERNDVTDPWRPPPATPAERKRS